MWVPRAALGWPGEVESGAPKALEWLFNELDEDVWAQLGGVELLRMCSTLKELHAF